MQLHSSVVVRTDLKAVPGRILPLNFTVFAGVCTLYYLYNVNGVFFYIESDSRTLVLRSSVVNNTSTVQGKVYIIGSDLHQNLSAICGSNNDTITFLLDGNGYIVASSEEEHRPGTNLFGVYPCVLRDLVTRGLYIDSGVLIRGYELQACTNLLPFMNTCEYTGCIDNAGMSMYKVD